MKNHFVISFARKIAFVVLFLGLCVSSFAQQKISGTVVDVSKQPVIGATVMVQGGAVGTVTDIDGAWTLSVPTGSTIVVSCIGYVDQTMAVVDGRNVYNVTLSEDAEMLEETVVIGYGTVKVRDLTGSVAAVGEKDLDVPVANVAQALQGKMAGVVVTMDSAAPGATPSIRVRGNKSITQSNDPLYIVDGFPVGDLSAVPADQIKSINVLKDAAATAIYGSRGAAGVVLVTTKNAIEGQTNVSYNGYVQIKDSSLNVYDVMGASEYLKFTLGYARDYNSVNYDNMLKYYGMGEYGNNYDAYVKQGTRNYQSDLYKTGLTHSHNIAVSNGTKRNKTLLNLNYMYDDGTVINSYYNRINASLKTIETITDKLNLELNISYNYNTSRGNNASGSAYQYHALNPLGEASNIAGFGNGSGNVDPIYDPVERSYATDNRGHNHNFRAIGAINWKPIEGMTARSEIGLNKRFYRNENYTKGYGNDKKSATLQRGESDNLHWTNTISYQLPIKNDNHRADVMVGSELIASNSQSMSFNAWEYPDSFSREQVFAFMNQYTEDFSYSTTYGVPGRSLSFFGRANYSLMDKYMFTFTMRADGSSRFAPNNRWGYFPAGAFAWRVIDEDFMEDTKDWLSNLKLRLSYGVTGSDAISANLWRETWQLGGNGSYTISDSRTDTELDYGQAYYPNTQMQNPNLKWETTITRNLGIDFGFFDERLYGTIEGYWSTTNDLLFPVSVNASTGYSTQYQNMGIVSNKGIELTIGGDIVRTSDFSLSANLVYTFNRNNVDYIDPAVKATKYGAWSSSERYPLGGEFFIQPGMPMGMLVAYEYDGWYTTDDFNYDPATGVYTLKPGIPDWAADSYWTSLKRPAGQSAFPGALRVKDQLTVDTDGDGIPDKADGVISGDDTYQFGEMRPHSTGSFNINARYKNFDLTANFNYVLGGHIMNVQALQSSYGSKDNRFGANRLAIVEGAYSPYRWNNGQLELVEDPAELDRMNANATMHTPTSMVGLLVDRWLEDASYLRLSNLTIGYTVPQNVVKKIGFKGLRAYFSGNNLFTLTGYSGLNPEVSTSSATTPGVDNSGYPIARTFTLGVNITL